jgi:hypothetical protein
VNATSRVWNSMVQSFHVILHWLSWTQGKGVNIVPGRDHILSLGHKAILSDQMNSVISMKGIVSLDLALVYQDPISFFEKWISAKDLGISGDLQVEWEQYCRYLNEAGVSLCEKEDTLIWIGGDSSRRMSVKNIYATLISIYEWPQSKGWKYKLWKWEIELKKKLFIWLATENKMLMWQVLQGKGWKGPGWCPLCKSEIEDVDHLFVHC